MGVKDDYGLIIITVKGNVIRMKAKDSSLIGRATQGVRLIKLDENDKVVSVARTYGEWNEKRDAFGWNSKIWRIQE